MKRLLNDGYDAVEELLDGYVKAHGDVVKLADNERVVVRTTLSEEPKVGIIFGGGSERPFWFTPKFTVIARPATQVAVGAMHIMNIDGDSLGVAYGAMTKGTRDTAFTVGVGYAYDHATPEGFSGQDYFPDEMDREQYYDPPERGFEREIRKRLAYWQKLRDENSDG